MPHPERRKSRGPYAAGNWLAVLVIPVAIALACFAIDLNASERLTSDIGRGPLLCLAAGVLELLVILSAVPWWSASLLERAAFGALIAACRVAAMTVAVTVLLFLLMFLQVRSTFVVALKVQVVVLCVGLLVTGVAGILRLLFRSTTAAALVTMLLGFAAFASPFWGNVFVQSAGEGAKSWAIGFVVKATPLSALASAVGYDLFRGRMLYVLSAVSDYPHTLPTWWAYALATGRLSVLALIGVVIVVHRRLT
ncbi:MAG: hypothetical protein AMK75_06950 [Planctomycetes bacterium SM23_65]|nr:MAG: hypothetical protein AMK75_06950 [Planctomycetes bacterium SM23_65]